MFPETHAKRKMSKHMQKGWDANAILTPGEVNKISCLFFLTFVEPGSP